MTLVSLSLAHRIGSWVDKGERMKVVRLALGAQKVSSESRRTWSSFYLCEMKTA